MNYHLVIAIIAAFLIIGVMAAAAASSSLQVLGWSMRGFITHAEKAYMLTVWLLLAVLLILILPINLVGKLLDKGAEAVTLWAAEIQAIAVAKMKE